jgi:hypothetical protein
MGQSSMHFNNNDSKSDILNNWIEMNPNTNIIINKVTN